MANLWSPPGIYTELEGVGLDVDGVARKSGYAAYEAICDIIVRFGGAKPSYAHFIEYFWHRPEYVKMCGAKIEKALVSKLFNEHHGPHDKYDPYEDLEDFCQDILARGLKLFALSGCPEHMVRPWFERHGIDAHFAHIGSDADDKHPRLTAICKELGVGPAKICYVGNLGADMRFAVKAGVMPVGMTRGYHMAEAALRSSGAKLVVSHLYHLAHLSS